MNEFGITRENAARKLLKLAAAQTLMARLDAVGALESLVRRRVETEARLQATLQEQAEKRDRAQLIAEHPEGGFNIGDDQDRFKAAATLDAERAEVVGPGAAYLKSLLADLDAERAIIKSLMVKRKEDSA